MGPPAGSRLKPKDGGRSRSLSSGTATLRPHSESPRSAVHPHPSTDLSSPCTHSARLYPQPALVRPDHGGGGQSVCTGRGGRGWSTPQTTPPTRTSPGRPCTDPNTTPHCASDTSPPSESQTLSAWSEHRGFRAPEVSGQAGPVDTYVWSACRGHAGPASCPPRLTPGGARGVSNVWESANPSPTEASPPDRFVSSSGFSPKLKRVLHDPQIIKNRSIKVVFLLKGKGASMLACASGPP